jgi:hypothetical protein
MAGPAVRWGTVAGLGALWWWAVLRLLLSDDAGVLEGAVAAGGWGVSVLPVHCMPQSDERGRPGRRRTAALIRRRTGGVPPGGDGDRTGSATRPTAPPAGAGPDAGPEVPSGGHAGDLVAKEGGGATFGASGGWPYGHGGHTLTAGQGGWPFGTGGDGPPRAEDDGPGPV